MPLVYLPESEALFLFGSEAFPAELSRVGTAEVEATAELVTPDGRKLVAGKRLPLLATISALAVVPLASVATLPASVGTWTLASKLALDLVARERVVPTIVHTGGRVEARWAAALSASDDAAKLAALTASMPPAAHAVPAREPPNPEVWAPDVLLRAFVDAAVDALVRGTRGAPDLPPVASTKGSAWSERWQRALAGGERRFEATGFGERSLLDDLARWSDPALGARDRLRACFRLELPSGTRGAFVLRFLLQSPDDPSLLVAASEVWETRGRNLQKFGRAFRDPQESLLESLGRAARVYAPLAAALEQAKPEALELDPAAAWVFLGEGASVLAEAGFGVILPSELTAAGQRRLRLRMRVGGATKSKVAGVVGGAAGLALDELLAVDWQAMIGDEVLSLRDLSALAKQKQPLVRFRGAWVAVDPAELGEIQKRVTAGNTRVTLREAVQAALAGETQVGELEVGVSAVGNFAELLRRLQTAGASPLAAPPTLRATLRPYQERGFAWLNTMADLGLGACLADDMGLGKTIQFLAFLLQRRLTQPSDVRPTLLVAPMSVVGNWQREAERFAPSLPVVQHYGTERKRTTTEFAAEACSLVLTTYGLLRRDAELLARVDFAVVALDEAQMIKNSASATARAARGLRGSQRFALTGTPVENRLAELWSILEFANPGLLGPLEKFRREFALPIERHGNDEVAGRLRKSVAPFILRRLKSDPGIIRDLPEKNEMKVICTLTREQATLYKAVVDEELRRIAESEGVERRGRVLALLTFTKQICNHPAQYLGESGPLARRSGKLSRVSEMLTEALLAGDHALVFTQFRDMGEKLVRHLEATLETEVLFLHGGTSRQRRDEMVQRFQHESHGPRVFVLSLKAGGTGLNLTAANHVFHYDRWWNPAVEDQATDRAYRIGQKRAVQVHKLLSAGSVEEKIDRLLEKKRELAGKIVGKGEQWITELGSDELRDLFALSKSALAAAADADEETSDQPGAEAKPSKRREVRA
jgi:hypothetical protein